MISRLALAAALGLLASCSTQIEEAESELYAPVFPVAEEPVLPQAMPTGGIYSPTSMGLFATDRRAAVVGDILTVDFSERFSARKSQTAGASRNSDFQINIPDALLPGFDDARLNSGASSGFSGKGSASQSNSLTGRVSVSVVRVLPGGNLEIMGQKKLTLNNGQEYIRLSGIVRPIDISADNVVLSDRVAHAVIKYVGAGDIADTGKQRWLQRVVSVVAPF